MLSPRFTITIEVFENPCSAPLIEVVVTERGETVFVASGGDLEAVMDAARIAIAECEGTE